MRKSSRRDGYGNGSPCTLQAQPPPSGAQPPSNAFPPESSMGIKSGLNPVDPQMYGMIPHLSWVKKPSLFMGNSDSQECR